jgi:hypothetical protein
MDNSKITTPKPFCFVLMPFSEEFEDVYRIGIKEACDNANAYCERVDEQIFSERIIDRIYNQIAKADIVIADMTGRNPNVFYEVGYAHALGKLTILLTQNADDIPFDLKHFPHIIYGTRISYLRDELKKRVKYFIANPPSTLSETKLGLELFLGQENLALEKGQYVFNPNKRDPLTITIFNSSSETFDSGNFKIGIITQKFDYCNNSRASLNRVITTKLPNDNFLHMMPDFLSLFPDAYTSFRAYFNTLSKQIKDVDEHTIIVKLFTKQGSRDFPITLQTE